jgi:succinate dehydrogenase hydrophobic anchor subunit
VGWDWVMLGAAVLHGAAGLRTIITEYAPPRGRSILQRGLLALSAAMIVLGSWTIARVVLAS